MNQYLLCLVLIAISLATVSAQPSCACTALLEGWDLDCSDTAQLNSALNVLESNNCDSSCSSTDCRINWHIVQAHHDFCDEDDLPEAIEDEFHDFEDACEPFNCSILRNFNPNLPDCPNPDCDDDEGNEAYDFLVANNCENSCSGDCQEQYYILRAYHDLCPEGALDEDAEVGIHDFEEECQSCNVVDDDDSQTTCDAVPNDNTCACDAQQEGWDIDCSDTNQMNSALSTLENNSCDINCNSELCRVNWHIVQAHHDFCDEDDLPEAIEDEFHDFEDTCDIFSCSILRNFNPNLPDCPNPDCDDDEGNEAYDFLVANNCENSCSGDCQEQYYILRAYHDLCPDGALDEDAEVGIHDFEEECQSCNVVDDDDSQTTCGSNSGSASSRSSRSNSSNSSNSNSSSGSSSSSSGSQLAASAVVLFGALALLL